MNSKLLLEQLTEIEEKIQQIERVMKELGMDSEREEVMKLLIACQCKTGRPDTNS
jgi:hypothetical protein